MMLSRIVFFAFLILSEAVRRAGVNCEMMNKRAEH